MYEYMKHVKSTARLALDKAKSGGKKAKGGKAQQAPEKTLESCVVFVAKEYPEWQHQTLEILSGFEFDQDNKV